MMIIIISLFFFFSFPVDFSTADIYNSSQFNNNVNNNSFASQPSATTTFNAFNQPTSSSEFVKY